MKIQFELGGGEERRQVLNAEMTCNESFTGGKARVHGGV